MLYELRRYEVFAHNKKAFHDRFEQHAMRLMAGHGFKVVGSWDVEIGDNPEFVYLLAWQDLAARQQAWDAFNADPEWTKVKQETHQAHGQLVWKTHSEILKPTSYSPLQ